MSDQREELIEKITKAVLARLESAPVFSIDEQVCETCIGCGECVQKRPADVQKLVENGASRLSSTVGVRPSDDSVAGLIDHTLLKPDAKAEDIKRLASEAMEFGFATVCVNPCYVKLASDLLKLSEVKVCTVVGFPLGANTPEVKVYETKKGIMDGAREIDMVINVGALKSKDYGLVEKDIRGVVEACGRRIVTKVIIETCFLSNEEKVKACTLAKAAGADYVKTSTGFGTGGATIEDVRLMREVVGEEMGVKASGGIKTPEDAAAMVEAGATRLGTSASVKIVRGPERKAA
jgi:deoxyribose-phosphate aldolase